LPQPLADGGWSGDALAFPRIQGADVCGSVVAVGENVAPSRIGERVLIQACLRSLRQGDRDVWLGSEVDGGFAQFVRAPARDSHRVESTLTEVELASFPCAYATAENLVNRSGVVAGELVLVTGATGGVGSAAVQLALRRGAHVVAVASAARLADLAALGASDVVAREVPLSTVVEANSVDVVIDVVGGNAWPDLLEVIRPRGRYAVSGAIAGPVVSLDLRKLYLKDLTFFGCTSQDEGIFENLVGYIERGEVRPLVSRIYPLAELVRAQQDFLAKGHFGKLIVIPPQ